MSPLILVLVQIPLDRNRLMRAPKMLRDGYHPVSIVFVWGEFLSVSWISLQHHGGFLLRTLSEQVQIWGSTLTSTSIYEIDDQDIIQCFPNIPIAPKFYHFWESSILICLRSQVCAALASDPWRWLSYLCLQRIPSGRVSWCPKCYAMMWWSPRHIIIEY